ncbi:MAG: hypothetical protein ABIL58_06715 [Pseudomonadota bacterium]
MPADTAANARTPIIGKPAFVVFLVMVIIGLAAFALEVFGGHPGKAWQVYLINFMVFSGIAQGGLVFSAIMHTTRARWSGPLSGVAESFTAFFPVSVALFVIMLAGHAHVLPGLHHDLHGKEVWLNLPFLFTRDLIGLLILYGTGLAYVRAAMALKQGNEAVRGRVNVLAIVYLMVFALILSLLGYDLIMSVDPHWYSTLFGAYTFVKAIYVGLAGIIITAALLHLSPSVAFSLKPNQFHDIGKLFFAFCLLWADFFYCQLVVIWYGNIPEETSFVIERTMTQPWNALAWGVFIAGFIGPFLILINQRIKTMPKAMIAICSVVLVAIWMEHYLVTGPAFHHHTAHLPLNLTDLFISIGFLGLMAAAVSWGMNTFPDLVRGAPIDSEAAKEVA